MLLTDCHSHLFPDFLPSCDDMAAVLVNAAHCQDWDAILSLPDVPFIHRALGLHPFWPEEWSEDAAASLDALLDSPHVRAVGEIGLDFWNGRDNQALQERAFRDQLLLAIKHKLPVCLHNRKSWCEFFGILKDLRISSLQGYCHNFTASRDIARQVLDLGLHISFGAPLIESKKLCELAAFVPDDRILVETDSPDMPQRQFADTGSRPWHVRYVLEALAQAKGIPATPLSETIAQNLIALLGA